MQEGDAMVQPSELIGSVVELLDHFKTCSHCDLKVFNGILDPCLLQRLDLLETNDLKQEATVCNGKYLAGQITDPEAISRNSQTSQSIDIPKSTNDESNHESDQISLISSKSEHEKEDDIVSIISVSTTSDVNECASSGSWTDPFSLPNIVSNSTSRKDAIAATELKECADTTELEEKESTGDLDIKIDIVSILSESDQGRSFSLTSDQNNSELDNGEQVDSDSISLQSIQSQLSPAPLIGRSALRNAFIQNNNNLLPKTHSTSPGLSNTTKETPVYYRSAPLSSGTDTAQEEKVCKLVTAADVNRGKSWKTYVELQGKITRCYIVPSENSSHRVKLLNFSDPSGVTQVTLRGDLSAEYDIMNASKFISVKGMCEKRFAGKTKAESKQNSDSYEVVAQSWSKLSDKENTSDNISNSSHKSHRRSNEHRSGSNEHRSGSNGHRSGSNEHRSGSNEHRSGSNEHRSNEPKFGSSDIRYKEPMISGTVKCDNKRTAMRKETTNQPVTRNIENKPPPLVSVENRGASSVPYSPTVLIRDISTNIQSSIVTWGTLSNATSTTATLSKASSKVVLHFKSSYRVESNLVIVEGTPFKNTNNQTIVAVERIEDLNPRHIACLKFLASSPISGAKSMRKISDMPKIIKGTDIPQFRGNFVLMRAKLENLQHGGKRSPSNGRVVCGDGASVHFSCVPFLLRNNPVKLGDQVVMIGKVNQSNKRSTSDDNPWITTDHLQVIPDKEADSVLGFTKSAIYEVLKQIVLETLKNDDRSLERDPWGFLND